LSWINRPETAEKRHGAGSPPYFDLVGKRYECHTGKRHAGKNQYPVFDTCGNILFAGLGSFRVKPRNDGMCDFRPDQ
jgi:hypothetical protein